MHGLSLEQLLESRSLQLKSFASFAADTTTVVFPPLNPGVSLLVTLPNELIYQVVEDLGVNDLFSLIMTAKPFAALLSPLLDKKALFHTYLFPRNGPKDVLNYSRRFTVLEWAAFNNRPDLIRKFLALKPSPSDSVFLPDAEEAIYEHLKVDDAILAACKAGYVKVLRALLETKAHANQIKRSLSVTLLHRAVAYEHVEVLRVLVQFGLIREHRDYMSSVLLKQAILMGNVGIVEVLVMEAGVPVDGLSPDLKVRLKSMLRPYNLFLAGRGDQF